MDRDALVIGSSLLVWLGAIALFLALMRSLVARYTQLFHARMRASLESAEFIVRTGLAPPAWRQSWLVTDPWPTSRWMRGARSGSADRDGSQLCLNRLERLIRFFERSPVVQGADARALLLEELRTQHQQWTRHGVSIAPDHIEPDMKSPNRQASRRIKIGFTGPGNLARRHAANPRHMDGKDDQAFPLGDA